MFISINPATGEEIARFSAHTEADIDAALSAAVKAQAAWRQRSLAERVGLLTAMARTLRAGKVKYARMITM
jgi:succinate-semialdehyde dehydrogenase/glutarate-semialdehyde dehydrogenase